MGNLYYERKYLIQVLCFLIITMVIHNTCNAENKEKTGKDDSAWVFGIGGGGYYGFMGTWLGGNEDENYDYIIPFNWKTQIGYYNIHDRGPEEQPYGYWGGELQYINISTEEEEHNARKRSYDDSKSKISGFAITLAMKARTYKTHGLDFNIGPSVAFLEADITRYKRNRRDLSTQETNKATLFGFTIGLGYNVVLGKHFSWRVIGYENSLYFGDNLGLPRAPSSFGMGRGVSEVTLLF